MFSKIQKGGGKQTSNYSPEVKKTVDTEQQAMRSKRDRTINPSIFISKTFQILDNQKYADIIRWNPDGLTFIIDDVERFEGEILPHYFRHRNFSSFVRQLNMYDFHKIRNEANSNIFEHKQFRRNFQQNLKNIKRKGCQGKKINPNEESIGEEYDQPEAICSKKTVGKSKATVDHNSLTLIPKYQKSPTMTHSTIPRGKAPYSPKHSPSTKELIEDFINNIPNQIQNEKQLQQIVKQMKKNPKYSCLNSREDLRRIVRKIKKNKLVKKEDPDQLEELSIQEEIMVENIDGPGAVNDVSLAIVSTEKCLPVRSLSFIGSFNFGEDVDQLYYHN